MDINLKRYNKLNFEKIKISLKVIVPVITLVMILFLMLEIVFVKDNKMQVICITSLVYINILLSIKIVGNVFNTIVIWNGIKEVKESVEDEKYYNKNIKLNIFEEEKLKFIRTKIYFKSISYINKIISNVQKGVINTNKNEKMNVELLNIIRRKLDKPLEEILTNIKGLKSNYKTNLDKDKETLGIDRGTLAILTRKSNNLKNLIEELFEVAKITSGDIEVEKDSIEIGALLRQALVEFKDRMDESNILFRINISNEKVFIKVSGEKIWRVLEIIIENLLKHSLENSRVYIDLVGFNNMVYLRFRNISKRELNIDPKDLVYIMNSNEEEEASGLGLEIAKNLVILQNGNFLLDIDGDLFKVEISFPIEDTEGRVEN